MIEGMRTGEGFYRNNQLEESKNIAISEISQVPYETRENKNSELNRSSAKKPSIEHSQQENEIIDLKVNNQNFEEIKEEFYHNCKDGDGGVEIEQRKDS